jgi:hypothetical protein
MKSQEREEREEGGVPYRHGGHWRLWRARNLLIPRFLSCKRSGEGFGHPVNFEELKDECVEYLVVLINWRSMVQQQGDDLKIAILTSQMKGWRLDRLKDGDGKGGGRGSKMTMTNLISRVHLRTTTQ